jgi:hypothetical protein
LRRPVFLNNVKIDWPNHVIGFFSALFGILIAFQLDEWRESDREMRLAQEAFLRIKNETNLNKTMFFSNVETNEECLKAVVSILPYLNQELYFFGSYVHGDSINKVNPFISINIDSTLRGEEKIITNIIIALDRLQTPAMNSSAWESAKATGALNFMNIERVDLLSLIYNDLHLSEEIDEFRVLLKKADDIQTKKDFSELLIDLQRSHRIIQREAMTYESYVNILNALE